MLVRPLPRVNLKHGLPEDGRTTTCTAGAGSLLLEFLLLSRLTGTVPVLGIPVPVRYSWI